MATATPEDSQQKFVVSFSGSQLIRFVALYGGGDWSHGGGPDGVTGAAAAGSSRRRPVPLTSRPLQGAVLGCFPPPAPGDDAAAAEPASSSSAWPHAPEVLEPYVFPSGIWLLDPSYSQRRGILHSFSVSRYSAEEGAFTFSHGFVLTRYRRVRDLDAIALMRQQIGLEVLAASSAGGGSSVERSLSGGALPDSGSVAFRPVELAHAPTALCVVSSEASMLESMRCLLSSFDAWLAPDEPLSLAHAELLFKCVAGGHVADVPQPLPAVGEADAEERAAAAAPGPIDAAGGGSASAESPASAAVRGAADGGEAGRVARISLEGPESPPSLGSPSTGRRRPLLEGIKEVFVLPLDVLRSRRTFPPQMDASSRATASIDGSGKGGRTGDGEDGLLSARRTTPSVRSANGALDTAGGGSDRGAVFSEASPSGWKSVPGLPLPQSNELRFLRLPWPPQGGGADDSLRSVARVVSLIAAFSPPDSGSLPASLRGGDDHTSAALSVSCASANAVLLPWRLALGEQFEGRAALDRAAAAAAHAAGWPSDGSGAFHSSISSPSVKGGDHFRVKWLRACSGSSPLVFLPPNSALTWEIPQVPWQCASGRGGTGSRGGISPGPAASGSAVYVCRRRGFSPGITRAMLDRAASRSIAARVAAAGLSPSHPPAFPPLRRREFNGPLCDFIRCVETRTCLSCAAAAAMRESDGAGAPNSARVPADTILRSSHSAIATDADSSPASLPPARPPVFSTTASFFPASPDHPLGGSSVLLAPPHAAADSATAASAVGSSSPSTQVTGVPLPPSNATTANAAAKGVAVPSTQHTLPYDILDDPLWPYVVDSVLGSRVHLLEALGVGGIHPVDVGKDASSVLSPTLQQQQRAAAAATGVASPSSSPLSFAISPHSPSLDSRAFVPLPFSLPSTTGLPPLGVDARQLFARVSPRNIITLVTALLCERRLLILSSDTSIIPDVIETLLSLIHPFQWVYGVFPNASAAVAVHRIHGPEGYILGLHPSVAVAIRADMERFGAAEDDSEATGGSDEGAGARPQHSYVTSGVERATRTRRPFPASDTSSGSTAWPLTHFSTSYSQPTWKDIDAAGRAGGIDCFEESSDGDDDGIDADAAAASQQRRGKVSMGGGEVLVLPPLQRSEAGAEVVVASEPRLTQETASTDSNASSAIGDVRAMSPPSDEPRGSSHPPASTLSSSEREGTAAAAMSAGAGGVPERGFLRIWGGRDLEEENARAERIAENPIRICYPRLEREGGGIKASGKMPLSSVMPISSAEPTTAAAASTFGGGAGPGAQPQRDHWAKYSHILRQKGPAGNLGHVTSPGSHLSPRGSAPPSSILGSALEAIREVVTATFSSGAPAEEAPRPGASLSSGGIGLRFYGSQRHRRFSSATSSSAASASSTSGGGRPRVSSNTSLFGGSDGDVDFEPPVILDLDIDAISPHAVPRQYLLPARLSLRLWRSLLRNANLYAYAHPTAPVPPPLPAMPRSTTPFERAAAASLFAALASRARARGWDSLCVGNPEPAFAASWAEGQAFAASWAEDRSRQLQLHHGLPPTPRPAPSVGLSAAAPASALASTAVAPAAAAALELPRPRLSLDSMYEELPHATATALGAAPGSPSDGVPAALFAAATGRGPLPTPIGAPSLSARTPAASAAAAGVKRGSSALWGQISMRAVLSQMNDRKTGGHVPAAPAAASPTLPGINLGEESNVALPDDDNAEAEGESDFSDDSAEDAASVSEQAVCDVFFETIKSRAAPVVRSEAAPGALDSTAAPGGALNHGSSAASTLSSSSAAAALQQPPQRSPQRSLPPRPSSPAASMGTLNIVNEDDDGGDDSSEGEVDFSFSDDLKDSDGGAAEAAEDPQRFLDTRPIVVTPPWGLWRARLSSAQVSQSGHARFLLLDSHAGGTSTPREPNSTSVAIPSWQGAGAAVAALPSLPQRRSAASASSSSSPSMSVAAAAPSPSRLTSISERIVGSTPRLSPQQQPPIAPLPRSFSHQHVMAHSSKKSSAAAPSHHHASSGAAPTGVDVCNYSALDVPEPPLHLQRLRLDFLGVMVSLFKNYRLYIRDSATGLTAIEAAGQQRVAANGAAAAPSRGLSSSSFESSASAPAAAAAAVFVGEVRRGSSGGGSSDVRSSDSGAGESDSVLSNIPPTGAPLHERLASNDSAASHGRLQSHESGGATASFSAVTGAQHAAARDPSALLYTPHSSEFGAFSLTSFIADGLAPDAALLMAHVSTQTQLFNSFIDERCAPFPGGADEFDRACYRRMKATAATSAGGPAAALPHRPLGREINAVVLWKAQRGTLSHSWKKRFFVLDEAANRIAYYGEPDKLAAACANVTRTEAALAATQALYQRRTTSPREGAEGSASSGAPEVNRDAMGALMAVVVEADHAVFEARRVRDELFAAHRKRDFKITPGRTGVFIPAIDDEDDGDLFDDDVGGRGARMSDGAAAAPRASAPPSAENSFPTPYVFQLVNPSRGDLMADTEARTRRLGVVAGRGVSNRLRQAHGGIARGEELPAALFADAPETDVLTLCAHTSEERRACLKYFRACIYKGRRDALAELERLYLRE